ncbi:MAG TPA: GNAT family N-acetyltransferase [Pirellulales bacterium]|nr:GNAT family N-acetyltransferase [Pirellulales bacterium]
MTSTDVLDLPSWVAPPGGISTRIVDESSRLAALQSEWEALGGLLPSPMETYGWAMAAAASVKGRQRPALVVAERDGAVSAVAQLARCRSWLADRMEIVGMGLLNEPADFACADRDSLAAVVRRAIRLGRPILLGRMPAESPTIELFRLAARGHGLVVVRPQASCPFIPIDSTWGVPESHLSSRRRSDYRRAFRRAEQIGNVRAEILVPGPDDIDKLLDLAFAVEARSWKGAAGTALACDAIRGTFIREFARWSSQTGILRIGLLRIGEACAAMQIAAEHNGALWLLKIGFDPAFANCSPGNLLLAESLRFATAKGLTSLEFLGTVEPWTRVWTDQERQCVSLRYYPFNHRGALGLLAESFEVCARRMWGKRAKRPTQPSEHDA